MPPASSCFGGRAFSVRRFTGMWTGPFNVNAFWSRDSARSFDNERFVFAIDGGNHRSSTRAIRDGTAIGTYTRLALSSLRPSDSTGGGK
jgi:hypothetical protein